MTNHLEPAPWVLFLDESIHNDLMTVGGFMTPQANLQAIAAAWRDLKTGTFNVPENTELKYSIQPHEPARKLLDDAGWNQADRVPRMLETISDLEVILLANTILDMRGQGEPKDYYPDALFWCIRRFANHLQMCLGSPPGPHFVVIDYPPPAHDLKDRGVSKRVLKAWEHVATAAFEGYQRRYLKAEPYSGWSAPSYSSLGFAPGLVAAHAKHDDLLQIADVVSGTVRDFCEYNVMKSRKWELPRLGYQDTNLQAVMSGFHRRDKKITRVGFALWPPNRHAAYKPLVELVDRWCDEEAASPEHSLCN
jgi:hypothetical protein